MTTCTLCGSEVTAKDPERYPYCLVCHYTGAAAQAIRAEQTARIAKAFPGADVVIEHTGGGCFWLAIRWPGEATYYVLTDGNAGLPEDEDGDPIPDGGWGYVGRHSDVDGSEDYEGTILAWGLDPTTYEPAQLLSDEQAIAVVQAERGRQVAARQPYRHVLVHLNVGVPANDNRSDAEIAAAIMAAVEVGRDDPSLHGLDVTMALAEGV